MAKRLQALNKSFEILALGRSRNAFAFADDIAELKCPVHWHFDDVSNGPPNLYELLHARPPKSNSHYYACGPAAMLEAFETACLKAQLLLVGVLFTNKLLEQPAYKHNFYHKYFKKRNSRKSDSSNPDRFCVDLQIKY
jgi:NAD(P)H-flavin reductase